MDNFSPALSGADGLPSDALKTTPETHPVTNTTITLEKTPQEHLPEQTADAISAEFSETAAAAEQPPTAVPSPPPSANANFGQTANRPPLPNYTAFPPRAGANMNGGSPQPAYHYPPQYAPYAQYAAPAPNYIGSANGYPVFYRRSPQDIAREDINKAANSGGALTIAIFVSMIVVAIIIVIVGFVAGIVVETPTMGDDPYMGFTQMGFYLYEGLTSLLSILIPTFIVMTAARKKHKLTLEELVPFDKIGGKKLAAIVFAGMGICMIAQMMSTLLSINFSLFGFDVDDAVSMTYGTGTVDIIMNSICTALIPALAEEFAYRGAVLGILKKYDTDLAIIGSAFLFGMLHGNLAQIPFAFVVGLVLGYVRVKTNSMLPNILIHFGNNFYAVIVTTLSQTVSDSVSTMIDCAVMISLMVAAFFGIYCLSKHHSDFFKLDGDRTVLTTKEKYKAFFTSGTVIASTIILCIETVAMVKLI